MTYPTCDQIMITSWKGQRLWVPLSNTWLKFYRKLDRLQTTSTHVQHATNFLVASLKGPTLWAPLSILQPKVDRFNCKLDWWCAWCMTHHVWLATKPIQLVTKIQSQAKQEFSNLFSKTWYPLLTIHITSFNHNLDNAHKFVKLKL
jgi:hypothetical protein